MGMEEQVNRIDASVAAYSDFVDVMKKNQPTILHTFAGLLPFFLPWQNGGRADVDFLRREYGDMQVPVAECSSSNSYGEERRKTITMREYLDAVHDGKTTPNPDYVSDIGENGSVLYLKDWHFQRLMREGAAAPSAVTETPFFFRDDWLNWWCDTQGLDDYRFVYMGPPGSFTGLHHDVLNSFSWSYNVCGSKHWTLFPPEATPDLYDRHGRELAKDVRGADPDKFPHLNAAPRIEVLQGAGEAIFVPSGWHHQVVNVGDGSADGSGLTISVNTNWFNGFNLERVHAFLRSELSAVRAALDHLRDDMSSQERGVGEQQEAQQRDWERQCELVMRANSGLNVTDFARMVTARARYLLTRDSSAATGVSEAENTGVVEPARYCPRADNAAVGMGRAGGDSERDRPEKIDVKPELRNGGGVGDSCDGRGDAWREERWTALALAQIAAVLRELSVAPAIDHIFVGGDDDDRGLPTAGGANSTLGLNEGRLGEGGDGKGSTGGLQETLRAVEAHLSRRRSPSRSLDPPVV